MTQNVNYPVNPDLDLVLQRELDIPPALVWEAWTTPEHIKEWFAPKPWSIGKVEVDLRPGGVFSSVLVSPEGQEFPNDGCYLEVVPMERLVWTDALAPGFRPKQETFFTAVLLIEPLGAGTRYTAIAIHKDEAGRQQHEEMGFQEGWGTVVDQMVEYMKNR